MGRFSPKPVFPIQLPQPFSVNLARAPRVRPRTSPTIHASQLPSSDNMGLLRTTIFTGVLGATGAAACLAARNPVISPIAATDTIWTSSLYRRHNPSKNPATQDYCVKRIPLDRIRPDLLQNEGDLTLEFCRGVWSGWGLFFFAF